MCMHKEKKIINTQMKTKTDKMINISIIIFLLRNVKRMCFVYLHVMKRRN